MDMIDSMQRWITGNVEQTGGTSGSVVTNEADATVRTLLGNAYDSNLSPAANVIAAIRRGNFPTAYPVTLKGLCFAVEDEKLVDIPPNVKLVECEVTAGHIRFSAGELTAVSKGATADANGAGAVANATASGAEAVARKSGAVANAKMAGAKAFATKFGAVANATVSGAEAIARISGAMAYATTDGAKARAAVLGAKAVASVPGALAIQYDPTL
jgi:hypothetical protein